MKRAHLSYVLCVVATASVLMACRQPEVLHRESGEAFDELFDKTRLEALLKPVEPWPGFETNYSSASWDRLIEAAKIIQRSDAQAVQNVLHEFQIAGSQDQILQHFTREQIADDGKLYLLMRVVFDLPEAVTMSPGQHVVISGAWMGRWVESGGQKNADGTVNLAWPLKWNHGQPQLTGGYVGLQGINARYDAAAEYDYFRDHYRLRKLRSK